MIFRYATFAGMGFCWEQETKPYYIPFIDGDIEGIFETDGDIPPEWCLHDITGLPQAECYEINPTFSIGKRYVLNENGEIPNA